MTPERIASLRKDAEHARHDGFIKAVMNEMLDEILRLQNLVAEAHGLIYTAGGGSQFTLPGYYCSCEEFYGGNDMNDASARHRQEAHLTQLLHGA